MTQPTGWSDEMIEEARRWDAVGAADATEHLHGVDLTGLSPQQALALGHLTAELIFAAEARGYRKAITALRDEARYARWFDEDRAAGTGQFWPGWYHAPRFADYLEAIAEEGGGPVDRRDTPERREERALWLRDIARILRGQTEHKHHPEFVAAADWLDPPRQQTIAEEGK